MAVLEVETEWCPTHHRRAEVLDRHLEHVRGSGMASRMMHNEERGVAVMVVDLACGCSHEHR